MRTLEGTFCLCCDITNKGISSPTESPKRFHIMCHGLCEYKIFTPKPAFNSFKNQLLRFRFVF